MRRSAAAMLMILAAATLLTPALTARRRVTPNTTAATTTQSVNEMSDLKQLDDSTQLPPNVVHAHDMDGNVIYVDTITGSEWIDSAAIKVVPRMTQPLMYAVSVGVNVWDPVMRAFGQRYGLIDFMAELNLHNRYLPVFEAGLGQADVTPDNANYTYRSSMAPYFKLGCNYNFLYNSDPRYLVYAGVRYGWTSFSYRLDDVSLDNSYWGTQSTYDIPSQTASVGYLELMVGLRVGIAANFSLGWAVKYHALLHGADGHRYGDPWYIPGFGTRGSALTGAFTLTYTLPLSRSKAAAEPILE